MNKLRLDVSSVQLQLAGYGFLGDPNNPIAGRYYDYSIYVGGY
jgi:hypothetical protein